MSVLNFLISDIAAEELFNSLKISCLNTGTQNLPSFGNESSFLNSTVSGKKISSLVLAIDVGGTRTKVCVRKSSENSCDWQEIVDFDNNDLETSGSTKGLVRMTAELGRRIAETCSAKGVPLDFDGISIVWSNKLQCYPLSGKVRGVGAKVYGTDHAYRKGEWWNADISDGDSISDAFLNGLNAASIKSPVLVVGNDTIFTAKALTGSTAGVVASTGANTTITPVGSTTLYNSECGGIIPVPYSFFGVKNCAPNEILKLEDTCAGKGLPGIFKILIAEAESLGASELSSLHKALQTQDLSPKDFAAIAGGKIQEIIGAKTAEVINEKAAQSALKIAQTLAHNAGIMCAVLILISVSNQLDSSSDTLVALDSSQARFVPGYKEAIDSFLDSWNTKYKKKVRYELLTPDGRISVPLRGAANSIEEFQ